jgi:hypothetical protein
MLENLRAHGVGLLLGVVFLVVAYKASDGFGTAGL